MNLSTQLDWKADKRAEPVTIKPRGWLSEKLSPRQAQICQLLFDGLTCKEIAERLNLSSKTAQTHIDNSYRKLGVRNRAQLYHRMMAIMPSQDDAGLVERVSRLEKRLDLIAQVFQSFEALSRDEEALGETEDLLEDELEARHC